MVFVKAARKPDRQADGETFRVASVQPAECAGSLAARRFPTVLGVCEPCLGREAPRPVLYANDAEQVRTDDESSSQLTQPPEVDSLRVPCEGALSSGTVEGFNNKVKLTTRKSYGFRTYEAIETSLYHNLGALPKLELTHRFW